MVTRQTIALIIIIINYSEYLKDCIRELISQMIFQLIIFIISESFFFVKKKIEIKKKNDFLK